jgi:hypothetical protein
MPEGETPDIETSELADRLVPDAGQPQVRVFRGFILGRSQREGYLRLYTNTGMRNYLEFQRRDVVHAQQLPSNRTLVWVRPEARVDVVRVRSGPAEFLQGPIQRSFLEQGVTNGFRAAALFAGVDQTGCASGDCGSDPNQTIDCIPTGPPDDPWTSDPGLCDQ